MYIGLSIGLLKYKRGFYAAHRREHIEFNEEMFYVVSDDEGE